MRTVYHSGNCPGHVLGPGEPLPSLATCQQYPDTIEDFEVRDPLLNALWREVQERDRGRK